MIVVPKPLLAPRSPPPSGCVERPKANDCDSCGAIDDADLERLGALAEVLNLRARAVLIREGEFAPHVFNITTFPHTYKA